MKSLLQNVVFTFCATLLSSCFFKPDPAAVPDSAPGIDATENVNACNAMTNTLPADAVVQPNALVRDLDGDGYDDIVWRGVSSSKNGYFLWIAYGGPSFSPVCTELELEVKLNGAFVDELGGIAVEDLNSDGVLDLLLSSAAPNIGTPPNLYSETVLHIWLSSGGKRTYAQPLAAFDDGGLGTFDVNVPKSGFAVVVHEGNNANGVFFGSKLIQWFSQLDPGPNDPNVYSPLKLSASSPIADHAGILGAMEESTTKRLVLFGTTAVYRSANPSTNATIANTFKEYAYTAPGFFNRTVRTRQPDTASNLLAITFHELLADNIFESTSLSNNGDLENRIITLQKGGIQFNIFRDAVFANFTNGNNLHMAALVGHDDPDKNINGNLLVFLPNAGLTPADGKLSFSAQKPVPSVDYDTLAAGRFSAKAGPANQIWIVASNTKDNPPICWQVDSNGTVSTFTTCE
jgi:hypothetical protein